MMTRISRLPRFTWNLVAVFFLCWFVTVSWLLYDGEQSAIVRFAFAFCGSSALFAGSAGGGSCALIRFARRFSGWIISLILAGMLIAMFKPVFDGGYQKARASSSLYFLRRGGFALKGYMVDSDGILPTRLDWATMEPMLCPCSDATGINTPCGIDPASREPFVWRRVLSGLRLSDVTAPEKVVVAYSQPYTLWSQTQRSVLFLDGHVKSYSDDSFWKIWSEQPPLPKKPKHNATNKSIEWGL